MPAGTIRDFTAHTVRPDTYDYSWRLFSEPADETFRTPETPPARPSAITLNRGLDRSARPQRKRLAEIELALGRPRADQGENRCGPRRPRGASARDLRADGRQPIHAIGQMIILFRRNHKTENRAAISLNWWHVRRTRFVTSRISNSWVPPGASSATSSPSILPISARATGEVTEILPCLRSASSTRRSGRSFSSVGIEVEQHHGRRRTPPCPGVERVTSMILGVRQLGLDVLDPSLDEALLLARRVVFGVLFLQIAMRARLGESPRSPPAASPSSVRQFGAQRLGALQRHGMLFHRQFLARPLAPCSSRRLFTVNSSGCCNASTAASAPEMVVE